MYASGAVKARIQYVCGNRKTRKGTSAEGDGGWGQRERVRERERERERESSNSTTLTPKDNSIRSIWTCLPATPCYTTKVQTRIEKKAIASMYPYVFAQA